MGKRLGLLFSDGSILVLSESTTVEMARKEAEEHDQGEPSVTTRIARLKIAIVEIV